MCEEGGNLSTWNLGFIYVSSGGHFELEDTIKCYTNSHASGRSISPLSQTLSWLRANQSLFLLFKAMYLAEKHRMF